MATSNNKRIEETATNALKSVLLRCPILESFIGNNDKTPSWDGTVFVYRSENLEKANLLGRAPIQVKGTKTVIISETASFSCKTTDLRNYYMDGGCIFFLISVNTSTGDANIYYSSLQVFDLKKILDNAGRQKTITIRLNKFPQQDSKEIAAIFLSFVENSRKQTSFIGKEIPSLQQLEKNGTIIESLSFHTPGVGLKPDNIGNFLSTHDFYLYAKPQGLDIDIPVEKVSNAIVTKNVLGKVMVQDTEYYSSYNVIYEKGTPYYRIGKSISIVLELPNRISVNFQPSGILSDFIKDASCFLDMIEKQEITLNGRQLCFYGMEMTELENYKYSLQYYKDVKRMLDLLGVTEELQCEKLSPKDETNIRNLVNDVLYNRGIVFPNVVDKNFYGPFVIANLSIWIWAVNKECDVYQVQNYFDAREIPLYSEEDITYSNPILASHFLLLNKDAFVHTSNMDYERIKNDICSMVHEPLIVTSTIELLLNTLRGYDEQEVKDDRLLDLSEAINKWLASDTEAVEYAVLRLNQLQIEKRRRPLTTLEIIELGKFTDDENSSRIRCGAYLLLEDSVEAQKIFDTFSKEEQEEFITYPICHFGKLIQGGKQ